VIIPRPFSVFVRPAAHPTRRAVFDCLNLGGVVTFGIQYFTGAYLEWEGAGREEYFDWENEAMKWLICFPLTVLPKGSFGPVGFVY